MKKSLVVVAAATLMTTLAFAAPQGGERGHRMRGNGMHGSAAGEHRGFGLERMAERLDLSEAQKLQMKQLHESFRDQTEPARAQMRQTMTQLREARQARDTARAQQLAATLEGQRAQLRQLREGQHERMLALLTAEQRAQVEQMKSEREKRRGERRERRGNRSGGEGNHRGH